MADKSSEQSASLLWIMISLRMPTEIKQHKCNFALFVWLISHQPVLLFSQNKPAISNQPTVLFSQNKPAPAKRTGCYH
jgi:hypothetical protein